MYDMDPQIALYTLPLLVAYPIQLLAGSFFAPYLRKYVRTECSRLGIKDDDDNNDDGDSETGKSSGDDSSFVDNFLGKDSSNCDSSSRIGYASRALKVLKQLSFSSQRSEQSLVDTTGVEVDDSVEKGETPLQDNCTTSDSRGVIPISRRSRPTAPRLPKVVLKEFALPSNVRKGMYLDDKRKSRIQQDRRNNEKEIVKNENERNASIQSCNNSYDGCEDSEDIGVTQHSYTTQRTSNVKVGCSKGQGPKTLGKEDIEISKEAADSVVELAPAPVYNQKHPAFSAPGRRNTLPLGRMTSKTNESSAKAKPISLGRSTSFTGLSLVNSISIDLGRSKLPTGPPQVSTNIHKSGSMATAMSLSSDTNNLNSRGTTHIAITTLARSNSATIGHAISMTGETKAIRDTHILNAPDPHDTKSDCE